MSNGWVLEAVRGRMPLRGSRALSRAFMDLVAEGQIEPGFRMPTVRSTASALGMSPAAVALAWRELVEWRVLKTMRRGGSVVVGPPVTPRATRFDSMMRASAGLPLNLGDLTPDPALVPPIEPALLAAIRNAGPAESGFPITTRLREAVAAHWPVKGSALLAAHGGIDAVDLALRTAVRPGDRVMVEAPGVSRVLDIIDAIGATALPVAYGPQGPDLAELAAALKSRPAAFVYQPLGQHPTGRSITRAWLSKAGGLLAGSRFPIIEIVQSPLLHNAKALSLSAQLPDRVVHILSFTFFFGADLRVAVAGGSTIFVDRMAMQLTYSSRWVSRLLQDALAFQLTDKGAQRAVAAFVETCLTRKRQLTEALLERGFDVEHHAGPSIWLPVSDEASVVTQMSRKGIAVHPGRYFSPKPLASDHILLNGTVLKRGQVHLVQHLANASFSQELIKPKK